MSSIDPEAEVPVEARATRPLPLGLLRDVEMQVTVELGRTKMAIGSILSLLPGDVVELDRSANAPVDVLINGTLLAHGEVVLVDDEFGVRITEVVEPEGAAAAKDL